MDNRIANLQTMAQLVHDVDLWDLARCKQEVEKTTEKIFRLRDVLNKDVDPSGASEQLELNVLCTHSNHSNWCRQKIAELNMVLAGQRAELETMMARARMSMGRKDAVTKIRQQEQAERAKKSNG